MPDRLDQKFSENYKDKVKHFISTIEGENLKGMPEPFLPVYGKGYSKSPVRIMFMGWETRNANSLEEFVHCAKEEINDVLYWFSEEFDEFEFRHWRSNFGTDFWTFNLKFLAKFYGINNWKELCRDTETHENILSSFVWANCDSIERYEVTAQQHGIALADWQKIKKASEVFDNPKLIFNALEPDLVVLLHWHKEEEWLLNGIQVISESEPYPYLWHYNCLLDGKEMQIFWTYHPRAMPQKGISYDKIIGDIISIYNMNITRSKQ